MLDLAYPIDDTVIINGEEYTLDLSFDNVLRLIYMLNDEDLTDAEQIQIGISMLIDAELDMNIEEQNKVFEQLFKGAFGDAAEKEIQYDLNGDPMPNQGEGTGEKIYSIQEDASYIFASFYQDYGIDLYEMQGKLHWHKFQAMLQGLRKDTHFKEIIDIRTMDMPKGKGTAKQKEQVQKLKEHYKLKGTGPI